jgi:hypothetical protein
VVFLVVALVAAVLGFGGVAGVALEGARLLFWVADRAVYRCLGWRPHEARRRLASSRGEPAAGMHTLPALRPSRLLN